MGNARDYIPALRYGHKIGPNDIGGLIGLPYVGNIIYVDPSAGSDNNNGNGIDNAMATVAAAYARTTSGKNDVVLIVPTGGTGRTSESTAITWAKRFTHLVGSAAPTVQDARAGISFATGGSLTGSENGCLFKNLTFNGTADINVPVTFSGDYNAFVGVDFKGSLNATTGDDADARALLLSGAQENYFNGCTFGADTFARSTTNATVEFASAASRNVFEGCRFIMQADNVGPNHILLTGTNAIDRWIEFKDCFFEAFWVNDADKITHVIDAEAQTATGHIYLTGNTVMAGADNWEAVDSGRVYAYNYTATANIIGKLVQVDVA